MKAALHPVVLIVDDHQVNQRLADILLKGMGLGTLICDDGQQAVEAYIAVTPALILMDIMMPVMDGLAASKEIRRLEFAQSIHTPIIACTALEELRVVDQCISSGIDDYLQKPYSRDLLARKLERWLGVSIQREASAPAVGRERYLSASENVDHQSLQLLYGVEKLDDVLVLFLTVTETLLAQLDSAIQQFNIVNVRRIAHEIRAGSLQIEARDMAKLCIDLEEAGENWPEVIKIYPALALAFSKVKGFLQLTLSERQRLV